jgi:hypothetical protein
LLFFFREAEGFSTRHLKEERLRNIQIIVRKRFQAEGISKENGILELSSCRLSTVYVDVEVMSWEAL